MKTDSLGFELKFNPKPKPQTDLKSRKKLLQAFRNNKKIQTLINYPFVVVEC